MFKSIIAFGDSNVVGFESIDLAEDIFVDCWLKGKKTILQIDEMFKSHSFPNLLSEKLNIPCENYAMSGSCNDRSLRILSDVIPKKEKSLIIFGYTNTERKEFYYPDQGDFINRDDTDFMQVGVQWNFLKSRNSLELNDLYLKNFLRSYNDIDQKILIVESLAKYFNCEVLHLMMYPEDRSGPHPLEFNFQGKRNFRDWAIWKGFKIKTLNHFGKEAHIELSNLLFDYIKQKYS